MRTKKEEKIVIACFIFALLCTAFLIHINYFNSFIMIISLYGLGVVFLFGLLGVVADILVRKDNVTFDKLFVILVRNKNK